MKFGDFQLCIPLESFLDKGDLKRYEDPKSHKEWSQVEIDVRIAPRCVSGDKDLQAKDFTCTIWFFWEGDEVETSFDECAPSVSILQKNPKTKMLVPRTYYIAVTEEMAEEVAHRSNILDYTFFHTAGYIPVCSTFDAACEALNQHCQKKISRPKVFKIQISKDSNLYWRADKFDKWKHKLFFPIPLERKKDTDAVLSNRWSEHHQKVTPYPRRWDWDAASFTKLEVEELI